MQGLLASEVWLGNLQACTTRCEVYVTVDRAIDLCIGYISYSNI